MIPRLGSSSLSFKANELTSVRDGYNSKVEANLKIAQNQNDVVMKNTTNSVNNTQIMMQGKNTQKLDVIA